MTDWEQILSIWIKEAEDIGDISRANKMRATFNYLKLIELRKI